MIKRILTAVAVLIGLSGCVAYTPYYVPPVPVYVQPRPVYVAPPVYYRPAPRIYYRQPACYWTPRWDSYYRTYRNVRICR
jgi:hypothetical protein